MMLLKRTILFVIVLLITLIISLVLLPFVLVLALIPLSFYFLQKRPKPSPKGTIEILPPEKKPEKKSDDTTPTDIEFEILPPKKGKDEPDKPS